jgi:nucleotide-binding universal stress UspA family protein
MFNKILVLSDGSGPSMNAARAAGLIAKAVSGRVTVVTVASVPEQYMEDLSAGLEEGYIDEWEHVLEATVKEVKRQGVEAEGRLLRQGEVVRAAFGEIERGGYDLVIAGRTGQGSPSSRVMGSVSDALVAKVACSIMIVR